MKKTKFIHIRVSEKEKAFLQELAERLNMKLSEVIRRTILTAFTLPRTEVLQAFIDFLKGTFEFNDEEGTIKPLYPEYYVINTDHYTADNMEVKKYLLIWFDHEKYELVIAAIDWTSLPIPRYWIEKFITKHFELMWFKRIPIWKLMML